MSEIETRLVPRAITESEKPSPSARTEGWKSWTPGAGIGLPAGLHPGDLVEVRRRDRNTLVTDAAGALWDGDPDDHNRDVVAYRLVSRGDAGKAAMAAGVTVEPDLPELPDGESWVLWDPSKADPYFGAPLIGFKTVVRAVRRDGLVTMGRVEELNWGLMPGMPGREIVAYRIVDREIPEEHPPVSAPGRPGVGVWIQRAKPDWRSQSIPDLRAGDRVEVKFRHGKHTEIRNALSFDWRWKDDEHDIVSYRIVAPGPAEEPANDLRVSPTGGVKASKHKRPLHLLPFDALEATADVLDFGARKYSARNWEQGLSTSDLVRAAVGHLWDWFFKRNGGRDPETGLSHLAHASCCVLFLLAHELRGLPDDRPPAVPEVPKPDTTNWPGGGA